VDLRRFGYQHLKPLKGHAGSGYYALRNRLVLLDGGTVAVSFFVPKAAAVPAGPGEGAADGYTFETAFLDARTGRFVRVQQWPGASYQCGPFPVPGGRFVIWHGLDLTLHALDGETVNTAAIDPDLSHFLGVTQSPSGKTLIAKSPYRQGEHVLCLSSSTLREIARFDLRGATGSGYDSYVAAVRRQEGRETPFLKPVGGTEVVAYGPLTADARARKLITVYKTADRTFLPFVRFLDDHTLALSAGDRLDVLSLSGDELYALKADRGAVAGLTPCRDCDLVAFVTRTTKGGYALFDTFYLPGKVIELVYILNLKTKRLVELASAGWATWHPVAVYPALALAPDGCTLAHQADWRLEIYRICGTEIGEQLGFEPGQQRDGLVGTERPFERVPSLRRSAGD